MDLPELESQAHGYARLMCIKDTRRRLIDCNHAYAVRHGRDRIHAAMVRLAGNHTDAQDFAPCEALQAKLRAVLASLSDTSAVEEAMNAMSTQDASHLIDAMAVIVIDMRMKVMQYISAGSLMIMQNGVLVPEATGSTNLDNGDRIVVCTKGLQPTTAGRNDLLTAYQNAVRTEGEDALVGIGVELVFPQEQPRALLGENI